MVALCYKMIHEDHSFDFALGFSLILAPLFMIWEFVIEAFNIFLNKFCEDDPEKQTKIYMISTYSLASIMIILGISACGSLSSIVDSFDFLTFCGVWMTLLPFRGLLYNLFIQYKRKKNGERPPSGTKDGLPPPAPAVKKTGDVAYVG